jgi:hypothetical protein
MIMMVKKEEEPITLIVDDASGLTVSSRKGHHYI